MVEGDKRKNWASGRDRERERENVSDKRERKSEDTALHVAPWEGRPSVGRINYQDTLDT